jgi:hypothetical protein
MASRRLRNQKLGLVVGAVAGAVATTAVAALVLAVGSRDSKSGGPARPAARGRVVYTLRRNDVVRDPGTGTRCEASAEAGIPNLICAHTARGVHEAVFWSDELQVYGPGSDAMAPTYSFKWWKKTR